MATFAEPWSGEWVIKKLAYAFMVSGLVLVVLDAIDYLGGFFGFPTDLGASVFIIGIALITVGMYVANKKIG